MFTLPCPWCDHALVVADRTEGVIEVRCDDCATVVDLAPRPVRDSYSRDERPPLRDDRFRSRTASELTETSAEETPEES